MKYNALYGIIDVDNILDIALDTLAVKRLMIWVFQHGKEISV